jgi:hypothetical protein
VSVGLVGLDGLVGSVGLVGLIGFVALVGSVGLVGLVGSVGLLQVDRGKRACKIIGVSTVMWVIRVKGGVAQHPTATLCAGLGFVGLVGLAGLEG